jgi:hypothetical protein
LSFGLPIPDLCESELETVAPASLQTYYAGGTKESEKVSDCFVVSILVEEFFVFTSPKTLYRNSPDKIYRFKDFALGAFTHIPIILGKLFFGRSVIPTPI